MDTAQLIEHVDAEGRRLAEAADRAGWHADVPGLRWDVRALVTHVGGVHRWATDIVRTAGREYDTALGRAVGTNGPDDAQLLEWFRVGHAELVTALRQAPDGLEALTFLPASSPRHFWARRQAHETAIHRADAEHAAGKPAVHDVDLAQDGIAEVLLGFARRKANAIDTPGALALRASDGAGWLITYGGERLQAEQCDASGDATVIGTSSELYLWLWNRPTGARIEGDSALADLWRKTVRVQWS